MISEEFHSGEHIGTTSDFLEPKPYGDQAEILFGVIYIILMIIGIPSNIVSVIHFTSQTARARSTREYFKWIYSNIALVDLCITLFSFPLIDVFMDKSRDSVFFENIMFCRFWGFLWEVLPYYSVFLVLTLSISRMLILVKPMHILSKRILFFSMAIYTILLIAAKVTFNMADITQMDYTKRDTLCIMVPVDATVSIYPLYTFFNIILLAVPIIPICISCFLSISRMYKTDQAVRSTRKMSNNVQRRVSVKKSQQRHRRATVTVIIMTVTYILCNVPVFLNYVLYGVWSALTIADSEKHPYKDFYNTVFMYYYSWNSCLVLFVVINAVLNPIIYVTRMKEFRQFVIAKFHFMMRHHIREVTQYDQTESLS